MVIHGDNIPDNQTDCRVMGTFLENRLSQDSNSRTIERYVVIHTMADISGPRRTLFSDARF
jgi:hypothetical protein